jgi:hypothetical protein
LAWALLSCRVMAASRSPRSPVVFAIDFIHTYLIDATQFEAA